MKKLPIGIQTFEQIITQNYLYVDKTEYLYKLVSEGKYYFLSRPRRFGKSLTLSTLSAIFQGEKKLFKGLFIEKTNWNWESFPILYFDFSLFSQTHDVKNLSRRINEWIGHFEQEYHLQLKSSGFDSRFEELLKSLPKAAVILIDEYDKPILDRITKPEQAKKAKDILKGFYTIIKSCDAYVKFCMLTGVSKFSKISVFSGLNNLNDISMDRKYAELCGYTKEEMIKYFSKYFADFIDSENIEESQLLKQIEKWYNGFRFSTKETKVYNPISTMMLFDQKEFKHYWFETGTPAFLIELIKENQLTLHDFSNIKIPSEVFSVYEIENLQAIPLLFQTGYLTITDYNEERMLYTLDFPNLEVRKAFITRLLDSWTSSNQPESGILYQLIESLEQKDLETFFDLLDILFAKIPYDIHLKQEKYWQSLFYLIFALLGLHIEAEYRTFRGRIDAVINLPQAVYIFEFKLDKTSRIALNQIKEKEYYKRFQNEKKPVFLVGTVFDTKEDETFFKWEYEIGCGQ